MQWRPMKAKRRAVTASPRVAEPERPPAPRQAPGAPAPAAASRPSCRGPSRPAGRAVAGRRRATSTCRSTSGAGSCCRTRSSSRRGRSATASSTATSSTSTGSAAICCKGTTLKAADRQPDAARDRDAGRDAQLDRPPEPGRRRGHREVRRRPGRRWKDAGHRQRRRRVGRTTTSRSRGGSTACPGVAGIELNICCPNVGAGGLQFAIDAGAAGEVTAAVRRATDLPLLVKLSPNVADIRPIARAIADAGADALTAINTLSGIAVAPGPDAAAARQHLRRAERARRSSRSRCGSCTRRPRPSTSRSSRSAASPSSPTCSTSSRSGAVAVQVGTAIFADPTLPVRLVDELAAECRPAWADLVPRPDRDGAAEDGRARRRRRASNTGRDGTCAPIGRPRVDFAA